MPAVPLPSPRGRRSVVAAAAVLVLGLGAVEAQAAPSPSASVAAAPDRAAAQVLAAVSAQLGDRYAWGGHGPDAWDCSGLSSLWRSVGGATGLPRVSAAQHAFTVAIPREQVLPGDLVFFGEPVTHVGVLTGEDRMIDAAASRGEVVERAVWTSGVVRYGRVPRPGMPAVRPWTPPPPPSPAAVPRATPASAAPTPTATVAPTTTVTAPGRAAPATLRRSGPAPTPSPARPGTTAPARPGATSPARPGATATPAKGSGSTLVPLAGLPDRQARPSSALALRMAARARAARGATTWDDVSLVRDAWRRAGGAVLPSDREALVRRGRTVRLADARIGDLVVYNSPATHLGVYLGAGTMVDASATMGRVVVRRVYATRSVRLVRLG